ncbi:LysM domain-containing protein [Psychrobacillus insolitus]|uniref:LysM domain-containing protein n=2 Tax=Psychrobacillus insolitus TaxID=1461 RepID=A0A2W7MKT4_9BACI|nr:LysM domain-containing protein [Psychrobacillus insolitus]
MFVLLLEHTFGTNILLGGVMMKVLKENYFISLFVGLSILFILSFIITTINSTEEDYQIKIEHGDSLWSLADKFGQVKHKDAWINEVMAMNNMKTAHIKVGEVLIVPEVKETFHIKNGTELAGTGR